MKTLITILAIVLLTSCAAKKESMESVSTLVKNDSIYIKKETIKSPGGSYSLSIHEICDTITGEPKTITQYITRGNDSIALLLDKTNGLRLNISSQEKTISQLTHEKEKALEELASIKSETFVKYKVPKWAWYTLVFSILNIVYWLNRVFRFFSFPF